MSRPDTMAVPSGAMLYRCKAEVSRSCFILGDSAKDLAALRVYGKSPQDAAIHISTEPTEAPTRLSFLLPVWPMTGGEMQLQYRYRLTQGCMPQVTCALIVDAVETGTALAQAGPGHRSEWLGQVIASDLWRGSADLIAAGHDKLLWAMEFGTDPVGLDLIDVCISIGGRYVVFKGTDLLCPDAEGREESAQPAGHDLAGLIRMFELQYAEWGQTRQALAEEIDHLRRSLDDAQLQPDAGSARSR